MNVYENILLCTDSEQVSQHSKPISPVTATCSSWGLLLAGKEEEEEEEINLRIRFEPACWISSTIWDSIYELMTF